MVVLFPCLSFLVFFQGVDDGILEEFGGLGVSPGSLFDSLGGCLCGFSSLFPFNKSCGPFQCCFVKVSLEFLVVGDACEGFYVASYTSDDVIVGGLVKWGEVIKWCPLWVWVWVLGTEVVIKGCPVYVQVLE